MHTDARRRAAAARRVAPRALTIVGPILGGFVLGLAFRARLQRHVAVLSRATTALGLAVLALLSGWGFGGGGWSVSAVALVLAAQLAAVGTAAWLFRDHRDGPLLAFLLYGNPGFWSVPVTAALFGPRAAVGVAAYDLLTSPRLAIGLRLLRGRAPRPQSTRTALVDYAPMSAAVAGLALGAVVAPPAALPIAVVALSTALAAIGAIVLGVAWPRGGWISSVERGPVVRVLAAHLTIVPAVLVAAALAGLHVPDGAWVLALGPLPVASVSFAHLYGYSPRLAACALTASMALAAALLPLALWLSRQPPG